VTLRIVVATANPDKAREIHEVLSGAGLDIDLVPRPDDVPEVVEDGWTLLDNARLKARALRDATGLPAIADDTGLEVDALGGAPGVYSARYAGPDATYADNCAHLLAELERAGRATRTARFTTAIVLALPDGTEYDARGAIEGTILDAPRGDGGFGYDPVFAPAGGGGATFAEMTAEAKHAISHRGRALRAMAARMWESLPTARVQE
jgi:XTP/dITP diphosphohydrolase